MPLRVWLRERRLELGLDTTEAAARCGVSQGTYSRWENGKQRPPDAYLDGIAEYLGASRDAVVIARSTDRVTTNDDDRLTRLEAKVAELMEMLSRLRLPGDPRPGSRDT